MGKVTFELELEGCEHSWSGHCGQRGENGPKRKEDTQAVRSGRSIGYAWESTDGMAGRVGGRCPGADGAGEMEHPISC